MSAMQLQPMTSDTYTSHSNMELFINPSPMAAAPTSPIWLPCSLRGKKSDS